MKLLKIVANNFKLCEENLTISFVPTGNKSAADKEFELQKIDDDLYVFNTLGIKGIIYRYLTNLYNDNSVDNTSIFLKMKSFIKEYTKRVI